MLLVKKYTCIYVKCLFYYKNLFFLFLFVYFLCWRFCSAYFLWQVCITLVIQIRNENDGNRDGCRDVQKIVLKPIQVVGCSAQMRRSFMSNNVFDPKDSFIHDWHRVVSQYRWRSSSCFAKPVI